MRIIAFNMAKRELPRYMCCQPHARFQVEEQVYLLCQYNCIIRPWKCGLCCSIGIMIPWESVLVAVSLVGCMLADTPYYTQSVPCTHIVKEIACSPQNNLNSRQVNLLNILFDEKHSCVGNSVRWFNKKTMVDLVYHPWRNE